MSVDAFLASPEAEALADVPAAARAEIVRRLDRALGDVGKPLDQLGASEVHGWLLHAVAERFAKRDPLAKHVAAVVRAQIAFLERSQELDLAALRAACDATLPELEDMLVRGRAHHHHHHDAPAPFVREAPKVGRNDPCPCGSGKKFKKCHG